MRISKITNIYTHINSVKIKKKREIAHTKPKNPVPSGFH